MALTICSLNVWGGRMLYPLNVYLPDTARREDIDVFCFQEVCATAGSVHWDDVWQNRINFFSILCGLLPEFQGFFAPAFDAHSSHSPSQHFASGLACFVRKEIPVVSTGDVFVFESRRLMLPSGVAGDGFSSPRNLQYVQVNAEGAIYTICHFHGLWNGTGKGDTPERIEQSRNIRSFFEQVHPASTRILCGDFNLRPDTESLAILDQGMKNLIHEYGITSTRSAAYHKPERCADYMLVSSDICVESFTVPDVVVSDHLPLILRYT